MFFYIKLQNLLHFRNVYSKMKIDVEKENTIKNIGGKDGRFCKLHIK